MSIINNDNLLLINNNKKIIISNIEYEFYKNVVNEGQNFTHYTGKLLNINYNNFPRELNELLKEKEDLINNLVFSLIDDIDLKINKFDIYLEKSEAKIYNLYMNSDNEIDFLIKEI